MSHSLDAPTLALLEGQGYCVVATPRADGSIQTVVAWIGVDEGRLLLSSVEGRGWLANLRRNGTATVTVMNAENPGEYASIGARLASTTHEDGVETINLLSNKVLGMDYPMLRDDEQRVSVRLDPVRVSYLKMG